MGNSTFSPAVQEACLSIKLWQYIQKTKNISLFSFQITELNADVEKVKLDQNRLNNELEFIITQQNELEEMLKPLEESVAKYPPINYQQHTDTERENT